MNRSSGVHLAKRIAGAVDVRTTGLAVALVAVVGLVLILGFAPTALGLGLLATLLVVD